MKLIKGLPRVAEKHENVALDVEVYKQEEGKLHRPTGMFACLSMSFAGGEVYQITDAADIHGSLRRLKKANMWVLHNALYDLRQLNRWAKLPRVPIWDTMIVEQDLFGGYYNTFSLKDLVRRWLKKSMPKEERANFATRTTMTKAMEKYAAKDPVLTMQVMEKQAEYCIDEDEGIMPYYWDIDEPAMWALLDIKPARIDVDAWIEEARQNEVRYAYIVEKLGFNPNSPKQVKEQFAGADLRDTKATTLEGLINSPFTEKKWGVLAEKVLDARRARKLYSTYGEVWIEKHVEDGDLVYADWKVTGAETGRMSCRSPNLMQIPARRNPIFRTFFISKHKKGRLMVADVAQQEPRFLAHFSQDKRLLELIRQGVNLHQGVANALGLDYDTGKAINLGTSYGLTKYGLARNLSIPEEEAARFLMEYKREFRGVSGWMTDTTRKAMSLGYIRTASGRRVWMNRHAWGWDRASINAPIQGSAADHLKLALAMVHGADKRFPVTMVVHDEMVADLKVGESPKYRKIMKEAFIEAGRVLAPDVPMKVDVKAGVNWGAKKL